MAWNEGTSTSPSTGPSDGRPQLLSEKCKTCLYRPGNPANVRPGRVADITAKAIAGGGGLTCHSTLAPGLGNAARALCRGFYDAYGYLTNLIRINERLGGYAEVAPPDGAKFNG